MKKSIICLIIFISLLVIYEVVFNFLKSSHEITYSISKDDKNYTVTENYNRTIDEDYYYLQVEEDKNTYLFGVKNDFNKRKNIVKTINEYKKNDVTCMTLLFVNDEYSDAICLKGKQLYSYYSLRNDYKIDEIEDHLKRYKDDKETEIYDEIDVNINYIDKNEILIYHLPKEIVLFDNEKSHPFSFSSQDNYKNKYGILVNNYYVIPRLDSSTEIEAYLVYDLKNRKLDSIAATTHISINSYYNGIYNNELYITDTSNLRQYKIDPAAKTIKLIANTEEEAYVYENGKEKRVNIYDIISKETKFTNDNDKYNSIKYDKIFYGSGYAIYVKDGVFYKVYEKYIDKPIYLFKANKPVNIIVRGDNIYYIEYNKLQKFNNRGINTLLKYDELINNYDNIFDIYIRN